MDGLVNFAESLIRSPFICIGWIIIGLVAGELARRFMGARDQGGCSDLVLGLAGAAIGGVVGGIFGVDFNTRGLELVVINLVMATIGATLLVFLNRTVFGRR